MPTPKTTPAPWTLQYSYLDREWSVVASGGGLIACEPMASSAESGAWSIGDDEEHDPYLIAAAPAAMDRLIELEEVVWDEQRGYYWRETGEPLAVIKMNR